MIKGVHTMFYTSEENELRAFIRDKLGLPATDVGGGWLIFDLPEGKTITSATYDPAASDLLADSAEPKIAVLGPNRLVIDFDGGVVRGAGFNPAFKVTVE